MPGSHSIPARRRAHVVARLAIALTLAGAGCAEPDSPDRSHTGGLQLVVLSPGDSLAVGSSMTLSVTRLNATPADTGDVFWTVAPAALARITPGGVVTGLAAGTVYVNASLGSASGGKALTVWAP